MGWGRKIRDDEKLRKYVEAGRPFKPWDTRPRLDPNLVWVWEAFQDLQTCRPNGMGLAPIPWNAIHEWAVAHDVTDRARFECLIREMDAVVLKQHYDEHDDE